jgi:hypothetical protein
VPIRSDASSAEKAGAGQIVRDLDRAYLLLCIALLDHTLQGDHFESVVLSFLAVLGIDESPGGVFRGPLSHAPEYSLVAPAAGLIYVADVQWCLTAGYAYVCFLRSR